MDKERREPDSIRRKKRRTPEEIEELRRRKKAEERFEGQRRVKRTPEEIEELRRRKKAQERRDNEIRKRNDYRRYEELRMSNGGDERNAINKNQKKKKKSPIKKFFKYVSLIVLGCIILTIVNIVNFLFKINTDSLGGAIEPGKNESVNILVLGMDIGDVNQTENEAIKRTDTIMLVNYNPNTKKTQVVSIPRDTLVKIKGNNGKINSVYQNGGNELVKEVVEDMLDITVNYMVNLDYSAFRGFIDAIGGVDMEIEQDMIYDDPAQDLHINFKGGTTVHLDGEKAEEFFRWRKNNDGTGLAMGDLDRIKNQHKFLDKVVDKCKNPLIVFKAPKILKVVSDNMKTNIPTSKIVTYGLKIMLSMKNGVTMTTINTTPEYIGGISYVIYEKDKNLELIESLNSPTGATSINELTKKDAKVIILNGASKNGLASQVRTDLAAAGYEDVEVGNTDNTDKSIIMTDHENLKDEIMELLPKIKKSDEKSTDKKYDDYDVVIILGSDYKR